LIMDWCSAGDGGSGAEKGSWLRSVFTLVGAAGRVAGLLPAMMRNFLLLA
jgi:hypothetical protein